MNIVISIHKPFCEQIFTGVKPLEFRNNLPKALFPGDKVFVYETYAVGGSKKVVGEFQVKSILKSSLKSRVGTYNYLDYYTENILRDEDATKRVRRCKKITVANYYQDIVFPYMYIDDCLDFMEKNHAIPPDTFKTSDYWTQRARADALCFDCDNWLTSIGYINNKGYCYPYAFEIDNPIRYLNPVPITEFCLPNGNMLTKAPQSWCYTLNN